MPTLLVSFKKTSDGGVMFHGFTAPNDKAAEKRLEGHASICPQFGPAHRAGETFDHYIEIDALPEWDEEAIAAWVDEIFCLEDDDEEDEEEDDDVIDVEPEDK